MLIKNKKILHVITLSSVGGAQSVVVNLANVQCNENEVYVLSSSSHEAWKMLDKRVHILTIKELQNKIQLKDIVVILRLIYYRLKLKADIIHLHSSKIGMFGRLVFPTRRIVYTVHGFDSMRITHRKLFFFTRPLQNFCRFIVGVSKYDEDNMKEAGISNNVTFIYNGIADVSKVVPSEQQKELLEHINEFKAKYNGLIISIARDSYPKRIDLFLEIAKQMQDYAFVWIGNSQNYKKTDNVLLLGVIPNGSQLLRLADVFMLCSNYEGLPISILEALAFSKPIVSSAVGGVPEILDGTNGFAIDNNATNFISSINKILENNDTYQVFSINARNTYENRFNLDNMVNEYDKLYAKIVNQ